MARATNIYAVYRSGTIIGLFSVKHEAITAIRKSIEANPWLTPADFAMERWPDGRLADPGEVTEVSLKGLL